MTDTSTPPRRANTTRPTSPILDRREEKRELVDLNTRLERYINTVRVLNEEKKELQARLELARHSAQPGTKRVFETRIERSRQELETLQNERALLNLDIQKREAELAELEQKGAKLAKDLKAVKDQNVALELQVPKLVEDLKYISHQHEEEVKTLSTQLSTKNSELDLLRNHFKEEQAKALNKERKVWEERAKKEKELLEREHSDKHKRVSEELEERYTESTTLKGELSAHKAEANAIKEKIAQANNESQSLRNELSSIQEKNAAEVTKLQALLHERSLEITKVRHSIQEKISEQIQLENLNISLNQEIEAYRRLISGEELRLGLKRKFEGDHGDDGRSPKSQRIFMSEADDSEEKVRLKTVLSKSGIANIEDLNMEGRFIKISNMTMADIQLDGWWIQAGSAEGLKTAFKFRAQNLLPADGTIIVRVKVHEQGEAEDAGALAFSEAMIGAGSFVILYNELNEIISQVDIVEAEDDDDKEGTFDRVCMVM